MAYRRKAQESSLSDSIIMGPPCPFSAHSIGSRDGLIPRYAETHACVRCISALTEGRVSLDVHRIHRIWRRRFLEFWTFVEIGDPDECWPWHGQIHSTTNKGYYPMSRHWHSATNTNQNPSRVAGWFTWGDFGRLPVRNTCGDRNCCNPLHLRVLKVPHFFHNRKLDRLDLSFDSRKLDAEIRAFTELTRERQPLRFQKLQRINGDWVDLILSDGAPILPEPRPASRDHEPDPALD